MWSDASGPSDAVAGDQRNEISHCYTLLLDQLAQNSFRPDPALKPYIQHRIAFIGDSEWRKLAHLNLAHVDSVKAKRWLGWGFSITEFLIAPALPVKSRCGAVCSLGALVNLMVVVCDSLLDAGERVSQVLPEAELAANGGGSSPVTILLREYFHRLAAVQLSDALLRSINKAVARMVEAEIQTVAVGGDLPYSFWLRKSALPFVLMGLPAWAGTAWDSGDRYLFHLRWLYRVGRFFGGVDDTLDLAEDDCSCQPNHLLTYPEKLRPAAVVRIASSGIQILADWDLHVPANQGNSISRETFLHTIWGC